MLFAPAVTAQLATDGSVSAWTGPRITFWIIGVLVIGGALMTISRKNAVAAVMSLVATFFGIAATYAMLYAHFLAAIQVLVYAGAIMVLFIFVVMVLNRDESEPWAWRGVLLKGVGVASIIYFTVRLGYQVKQVSAMRPQEPPADFGTVAQVGHILFTDYLFVFEAVSILLLIAVIAAVVVARTHKQAEAEHDNEMRQQASAAAHGSDH
jgi:NADH-quinone oxidoreductase subunit J